MSARDERNKTNSPIPKECSTSDTLDGTPNISTWLVFGGLLTVIVLTEQYSYLMFHTLVEVYTVVVSLLLASVAMHTYSFHRRPRLYVLLGFGFLWVALFDMIHTLSYEGMGVIAIEGSNLAAQLWVAGRVQEAVVVLTSLALLHRKTPTSLVFVAYAALAMIMAGLIAIGSFPVMYIDGEGLTTTKIAAEYGVIGALGVSLYLLSRRKEQLDRSAYVFLGGTIVLMILAELAFTLYIDVYGLFNMTGHVFRAISKWLLYVGIVRVNLIAPYRELSCALYQKEQATTAAKELSERFRSLLENTSDLVWETDTRGYFTYVSPKIMDIQGYAPSEVIGRPVFQFMEENERERVKEVITPKIEQQVPFRSFRHVQLHRDGHEVVKETSGVPFYENGVFKGYRGISRDITEFEAERHRFELANTLLEASPTVLFRWRAIEGWPVDFVSKNISQFGYTADDFLSGRVPYASLVHPDDLARVGEEVAAYASSGAANFTQEYRIVDRSGGVHWIDDRTVIERDADGAITFYHGIILDITERKAGEEARIKAEQTAKAHEQDLRLLIESSGEGIFALDSQGVCTIANSAAIAMLGFDAAEDIVGKKPYKLVHIDKETGTFHTAETRPSARIVTDGDVLRLDNEIFQRADGSRITVYYHAYPMIRGDQIVGATVIFRDITEDIEAKRHAQISERMESLGHLAGGVAHDLNNMLLPIVSLTDMVLRDTPETERTHKRLTKVLEAATRAKKLVGEILAFSRQETIESKPLDVCDVVLKTLTLLRETIPTTVMIQNDLDQKTGIIMADASQLETILINLVVNGAQAIAPSTGSINVTLKPVQINEKQAKKMADIAPGTYAVLTVSDTGCGIPADIIEKIFDPFFTTKDVGEGTGLGLSVVFGTTKTLGGTVSVESTLDEGTTITVYLPIVASVVTSN